MQPPRLSVGAYKTQIRSGLFHPGASAPLLTAWQKNTTPRVTEGLLVLYLEFMYMSIGRTSLYMSHTHTHTQLAHTHTLALAHTHTQRQSDNNNNTRLQHRTHFTRWALEQTLAEIHEGMSELRRRPRPTGIVSLLSSMKNRETKKKKKSIK